MSFDLHMCAAACVCHTHLPGPSVYVPEHSEYLRCGLKTKCQRKSQFLIKTDWGGTSRFNENILCVVLEKVELYSQSAYI